MSDANVIAALRLAQEASSDPEVFDRVARELLAFAPDSDRAATVPVDLLLRAINESKTHLAVADA